MVPSRISFLTAAGKTEKPMGMLPNLPVTLGTLTLHVDCMVTKANNYNILVGNDWLRMAGADILLSSSVLRVRLGFDQYEDIAIDTDHSEPRVNMCQSEGVPVCQAVQCLEQRAYSEPFVRTTSLPHIRHYRPHDFLEQSRAPEYGVQADFEDSEPEETCSPLSHTDDPWEFPVDFTPAR